MKKNHYFILIFLGMVISGTSYAMQAEKRPKAKPSRGSMSPQMQFAYFLNGCKETFTSASTYVLPTISVGYYIDQNWDTIYNNGNGMNYRTILTALRQGVVNSTIIGGTIGTVIRNAMPEKRFREFNPVFKFILNHPYITCYGVPTIFIVAKKYFQNDYILIKDKQALAGLGLALTWVGGKYVWNNYHKWIPQPSKSDKEGNGQDYEVRSKE